MNMPSLTLLLLALTPAPSAAFPLSTNHLHQHHQLTLELPSQSSSSRIKVKRTTTLFNLGGNYLDNLDGDTNGGQPGSRWGIGGANPHRGTGNLSNLAGAPPPPPRGVGTGTTGSVRGNVVGSENVGGGRGGAGTAIRPPPGNNYAVGSGREKNWGPAHQREGGDGGGSMMPNKIFGIRQPQDLLDFVIQDERLSIVKVYASWCKTCQIFDIRYRKLASQIGDKFTYDPNTGASQLIEPGRVRFAEMQFDDPNNEEMCRLLNATKVPYILMYKGSKGKVADFQCGPSNFQRLIDEVNEFMDPISEGTTMMMPLDEMEWSVGLDQEELEQISQANELENAQHQSKQEGMIKRKDEEIARLYVELSTVRKEYEEKMATITEVHKNETDQFQKQLDEQAKEYEDKICELENRIKDLEEDMASRELEVRSSESEANRQLKLDMKRKEQYFEKETNRLSMRIAGLEEALLQSRKELKMTSEISVAEKKELHDIISGLEEEQLRLNDRIKELEEELRAEKRAVVTTAEQASRVLKELEQLKAGKVGESAKLVARIHELESQMVERENQSKAKEKLAMELKREVEQLKREHEKEREIMANRIVELENEVSFKEDGAVMEESAYELRRQSSRLADRIAELETEIEDRDRLLRTSNKATDLLLSKMEKQKREYQKELDRTNALANELEDAIASREEEMTLLQQKFRKLERMASGLKAQDGSTSTNTNTRDTVSRSQSSFGKEMDRAQREQERRQRQKQLQQQQGGDQWESEGEARIRAEREASTSSSYQKPLLGGMFDMFNPKPKEEVKEKRRMDYSSQPIDGETVLGDSDEDFWKMDFEGVVSPPRSNDGSVGAPRSYDESFGSSRSYGGSFGSSSGQSRSYDGSASTQQFYEGAGEPPSPSAAAFEQRIAANPIVPPGAFGASRAPAPSPRYDSMNAGSGSRQREDIWQGAPTTPSSPEMAAFEQRIAENPIVPPGAFGASSPASRSAPAPRTGSGAGRTDSIYAGAGTAIGGGGGGSGGGVANGGRAANGAGAREGTGRGISRFVSAPAPAPVEPQMPTPAMAFEQRLAANPIVPSGAFGGSQPTAHFFNKSNQNGSESSSYGSSAPAGPPGGDVGRGRGQEDDSQSKWAALDDAEKKRVAAEAYKAFEKNLADRRNPPPPTNRGGRGAAASPSQQQSSQRNLSSLEIERQKHQEMVAQASREKAQKKEEPSVKGNMKEEEIERLRREQEEEQARMQRLRAEEAAKEANAKKETAVARVQREKEERARAEQAAKLEKEQRIKAEKTAQAKREEEEAARRKKEDEDRLQREKEARARAEQAARAEKEKIARARKEAERRAQAMEEEARLQRAKEERAKAEARLQLAKEERAQRQKEVSRKKDDGGKDPTQSAPDIKFPKHSDSQRPVTSKGSAVAANSTPGSGDRSQGSWINRVLKEGKSGSK